MKNEYPDSVKAFLKADEAVKAAVHDFSGGFYGAAANRAYYACYYCITALLYTKDIYVKTHIGAKAKFTELFIKTGVVPVAISGSIASLFELRQTADYDLNATVTQLRPNFSSFAPVAFLRQLPNIFPIFSTNNLKFYQIKKPERASPDSLLNCL